MLNTYPNNPFPPSTDRMDVNALEAEVNQLKSGLTNVDVALSVPEGTGKNIFDKDNIDSIQKYYDGANWKNQSSNQWKTIFIPVIAGRTYTSSGFPHTSGAASVFVKADKSTVLLTLASANNNSTFVVPDMAEYVGFAIWSPDEDYTSAQLELGSTATSYTPYIPSVESRIEAVESGKANVATYNMSGGQTINIRHTGIVAIMSDRGSLYTDGISNRGVNDIVPSTQITVTHVDAYHVTVANNSQYGTSIFVLSDGYITITLVQ